MIDSNVRKNKTFFSQHHLTLYGFYRKKKPSKGSETNITDQSQIFTGGAHNMHLLVIGR